MRLNNKNELVIPFSNGRGEIRSYQRIPVTGGKDARILKDSEKTGNWFTFGTPENGRPLLFAEGYATAASTTNDESATFNHSFSCYESSTKFKPSNELWKCPAKFKPISELLVSSLVSGGPFHPLSAKEVGL